MWRDFCCELQHVFISHAFGQGGGKGKMELSAVWREWGRGLRCYKEHKERKEGLGVGVFFGDQVELSGLL